MSDNKRIVEEYMAGYNRLDRSKILDCLSDDVEWFVPGLYHVRGKQAFGEQIECDDFEGKPSITVDRLTEENNVVVAEGSVIQGVKGSGVMELLYCDVFEMRDSRIQKLTSYLAILSNPAKN